MLTKQLGKISSIRLGIGGYQGSMLGLHICFELENSGICTTHSTWDYETTEHTKHCKWTAQSRLDKYADIMVRISKLLKDAKVQDISQLKGIPVEIKLDGLNFYSYRILTEVL